MEINDELIACYVEGKCTKEETLAVRDYLCNNPEECERIVYISEQDSVDYLSEITDQNISDNCYMNDSFLDVSMSAVAFVPQQHKKIANKRITHKHNHFIDRLRSISIEVDKSKER